MMDTKTFDLTIVTPEETLYNGPAVSLVAPGEMGYVGILANHAPLLSTLTAGKVVAKKESGEALKFESTGKGFLEVFKNTVTLLLDAAKPAS